MNNEVKAAWIEALRSGEYGYSAKSFDDANESYCVLGVLASLVDPPKRPSFKARIANKLRTFWSK